MLFLIDTSIPPPSLVLSKRYGEVKPGVINWLVGKDSSVFVSVTIRISTLPITASTGSSNLFQIEFILMPDITIRFKFVIFISFSFVLKSSFIVTVVRETPFLDNRASIVHSDF